MVVKSLAAMVKRFDEVAGSNFGESIALSSERSASLTSGAIAMARDVGCMPVVVLMNSSSSSNSRRRARLWLTADWLRKTFWLARNTLRSCMIASKTRGRLRSKLENVVVICGKARVWTQQ